MQESYINQGLDVLSELLARLKVRNIFLVTGSNTYNSIGSIVKPFLTKINTEHYVINDSTVENIILGCNKLISSDADIVIAMGGGRVLDAAKLIHTKEFLKNNYNCILQGKYHFKKKHIPLLVLPTTSGTGSEATSFSVIYNQGKKFSVESKFLLPDYAILDVSLVRTMPPYLRACTLFDTLSQSIESLWANNATPFTKKTALESIGLVAKNINRGVIDHSYFTDMVVAAHLSGIAINTSKTTAAHAYSYYLTSRYNIPHGHAVAIVLGIVVDVNLRAGDEKVEKNMKIVSDMFNVEINKFSAYWYGLMKSHGLEVNLSKFGVKKSELQSIVHSVNLERLANHPVFIEPELMLNKLEEIM